MTFQPRLTPEREAELIYEYRYGNWSINDISVIFRISIRTVYRILDKHNVRTKTMNEGERQAVVRDYRDRGISISDLSFIYKVSRKQIYRILEKYEVELVNDGRKTLQKPQKRLLRALQPCGTNAAYQRHRKAGEYPCNACLAAHSENVRTHQRKKET